MSYKQKKTLKQHLKWWWDTRVLGNWRFKIIGASSRKKISQSGLIQFRHVAKDLKQSSKGITVILTAYRRTEYLPEQIEALRNQTHPPDEIWVWSNQSDEDLLDISYLADRVVISNTNWLFWGRFALAQLVRTDYVAFFDDDILPQPGWFDNCLSTIEKGYDGILGGSGVILPEKGGYSSKHKAGWNGNHLSHTVPVDLVGHAWFMRKEHVKYMWQEDPTYWENGEDIHLSYMALKHGNIQTFVPPHPENNHSLWSCRPDFGKAVGRMNVATYKTNVHGNTRSKIVDQYREDGWQTVIHHHDPAIFNEKDFTSELDIFNQRISDKENFSLVRFGDGEMRVVNGVQIDLSKKYHGEHKYSPDAEKDEHYRNILKESLLYKHPQYYVGLPCRCCVGNQHCDQLREQSKQDAKQLTWANIFVNANYQKFINITVPELSLHKVNIICHEKADTNKLPFQINRSFLVGSNAWVNDYDRILAEIQDFILLNKIKNEIFLFCAGVLSNMLIYQLTRVHPTNTYIDIGSVFDVVMDLGRTRKYLEGSKKRLNQVCIW